MPRPILKKFLENPSYVDKGKFGTFWMNKQEYDNRWYFFKKIFKTLEVLYYYEGEDSIYVFVTVPSERHGNTYDVVIHFYTDDEKIARESDIRNYYIQFFSNNPVLAFQFGHADYIKGLLIPFLADKLSRAVLEGKAEKNNPKDEVGFDHSFYHAGMYLLSQLKFLNKSYIHSKSLQFNAKIIYDLVRDLDQTIEEYHEQKDKSKNKERFNKKENISDKISDVISSAKAKIDQGKQKISKVFDKNRKEPQKPKAPIGHVHKITAKKSNVKRTGSSGVHRVRPRKSNT